MKHLAIISFAAICMLFACTKDSVQTTGEISNLPVDSRGNNVNICHKTGNGQFISIWVNQNAVPAHLAHGDYLPDADGDGYTAIGACTGSMDDCDDNDANVHPGAEEICGNGIDDNCDGNIDEGCCEEGCCFPFFTEASVSSHAPFFAYYDSEVSQCNILGPEFTGVWIFYENNIFPAALAVEFEDGKVVALLTDESECFGVVGVDITEEDYESAQATLRAVIAAHPETPNVCELFPRGASGSGSIKALNKDAFWAKIRSALPVEMKKKLNNKK